MFSGRTRVRRRGRVGIGLHRQWFAANVHKDLRDGRRRVYLVEHTASLGSVRARSGSPRTRDDLVIIRTFNGRVRENPRTILSSLSVPVAAPYSKLTGGNEKLYI